MTVMPVDNAIGARCGRRVPQRLTQRLVKVYASFCPRERACTLTLDLEKHEFCARVGLCRFGRCFLVRVCGDWRGMLFLVSFVRLAFVGWSWLAFGWLGRVFV